MSHHIPETYDAWRRCIEIDYAQPLTAAFIVQRLTALQDPADQHTQQFLRRWGPVRH
ncbi:hypothetical protein FHT03_001612 [Xanthomonas arboricola]|uniref:hypothetical protein n=1 Tax=Xanthomonas cannabis TaxID=1885674 RepID=UPI001608ECD5|nr:hypothetical protein [Xanthomonas cannabis]MBB3806466.1 hypothetical protein [Xanthomonas cannabis]